MNMPRKKTSPWSRREFLRASTVAAAAVAAPLIIPARLRGAESPSNRIRVGHVGCGRIAQSHDMTGVARSGLAEVVAVCDVDKNHMAEGAKLLQTIQDVYLCPEVTIA